MTIDDKLLITFPLGSGGPLHRLQCFVGLIREESPMLGRRVLWAVALCWVPLLLLWWLQPNPALEVSEGNPNASLLTHIPTYARFFVSLPLLIACEQAVKPYLETALRHALTSGIVPPEEKPAFKALLDKALGWQDSWRVELLLALLAIIEAQGVATVMRAYGHDSWALTGSILTWAGTWYFWISKPFLQFLIFRWIYRILIWWWVLLGMARLRLVIKPAHPDGRGGLAFMGDSLQAFATLALALSANVAGGVADFVVSESTGIAGLEGFIIGGTGAILMGLAVPLASFIKPMVRAKEGALLNYEGMAQRYCQAFDEKWHEGRQETPITEDRPLPEFSSMTDMNAMVKGVRDMKTLPYTRQGLISLVIAVMIPFVPVVAMVVPAENIIKGILHVLMGGIE